MSRTTAPQRNPQLASPGATQRASDTPELDRLLAMQHTIKGATPLALAKLDPLQAALTRADAIESLRRQLDDQIMGRFYPLMNTALGFRCDRPNKRNQEPYGIDEVRNCFIEALLLGLRLTDNEWNIISGRVYVTREGFSRLLKDHEALTDLRIEYGVPKGDASKGVVVNCRSSWMIGGVQDQLDAEIPVRGDQYATIDQLLGKCDRKMKCRIYCRLTGSSFTPEGEIDDLPTNGHDKAASAQAAIDALKPQPPAAPGTAGPTATLNGDTPPVARGWQQTQPPAQAPAEPPAAQDDAQGQASGQDNDRASQEAGNDASMEDAPEGNESQVTQGTDAEQPQAPAPKPPKTSKPKGTGHADAQPPAGMFEQPQTAKPAPTRPWHRS